MRRSFARSLAVGGVATLVDLGVLHAFVRAGVEPTVANLPSLLVGIALQFLGNKYWAFADGSRGVLRQGTLFALVEAGTFVLNAAAFHALVAWARAPYLAARPLASFAVYAFFSYPLWARVFRAEVSSRAARRARGCPRPGTQAPPGRRSAAAPP